jgi:hypothetical protein
MIRILNRRRWRLVPKEDRAILLICIGIALVFWLLVKLSQTYKAQKAVFFNIETPADKVLAKLPPDDLLAEIEGTGWDLLFDFFSKRELVLTYDMSSSDRLSLSRSQLRTDIKQNLYSDDIKIQEVNYDALNLIVENKGNRRVPIDLRAQLSFAPEHQLKPPIVLQPDSVTLIGPYSLVQQFDRWPTDSVNRTGLNKTEVFRLPLDNPPPELTLSAQSVEVRAEVEPVTEKSVYVPVVVKNAPDSLRIFPDKVTLTFKIGLSQYEAIGYQDFTAEIDLGDIPLDASNNTVPIVITKMPKAARSMYYRPKSAKFFIVEEGDEPENEE